MSTDSLPEIREAEAPPAIAAIYAALNDGIGIGQVNLIWRHAAALPGVLDWLWAQAAPALASGAAAAARDGIAAAIVLAFGDNPGAADNNEHSTACGFLPEPATCSPLRCLPPRTTGAYLNDPFACGRPGRTNPRPTVATRRSTATTANI